VNFCQFFGYNCANLSKHRVSLIRRALNVTDCFLKRFRVSMLLLAIVNLMFVPQVCSKIALLCCFVHAVGTIESAIEKQKDFIPASLG
jgi:hypothetical protein